MDFHIVSSYTEVMGFGHFTECLCSFSTAFCLSFLILLWHSSDIEQSFRSDDLWTVLCQIDKLWLFYLNNEVTSFDLTLTTSMQKYGALGLFIYFLGTLLKLSLTVCIHEFVILLILCDLPWLWHININVYIFRKKITLTPQIIS